jgi:hypothetical protein
MGSAKGKGKKDEAKTKPTSLARTKAAMKEALAEDQKPIPEDLGLIDLTNVPSILPQLPHAALPSKERESEASELPTSSGIRKRNQIGLAITPETDDCNHLSFWKGGVCSLRGNQPCPYLGGNQPECEIYAKRGTIDNSISARRAALRAARHP